MQPMRIPVCLRLLRLSCFRAVCLAQVLLLAGAANAQMPGYERSHSAQQTPGWGWITAGVYDPSAPTVLAAAIEAARQQSGNASEAARNESLRLSQACQAQVGGGAQVPQPADSASAPKPSGIAGLMNRLQQQALNQLGSQGAAATNPEVQKCLEDAEKAGERKLDPVAERAYAGAFDEAIRMLRRREAKAVLVDFPGEGRIVLPNGQVDSEYVGRSLRLNVVDDPAVYSNVAVSLSVALQRGVREGGVLWTDPPVPPVLPQRAEAQPDRNKLREALLGAAAAVRGEAPARQGGTVVAATPPEPVMVPPQPVARLATAPAQAAAPAMSPEATILVEGQPVDLDSDDFRSARAREAYLQLKGVLKLFNVAEMLKKGEQELMQARLAAATPLGSFNYVYAGGRGPTAAPRNAADAQVQQQIDPVFAALRALSQPERAEALSRIVRDAKSLDNDSFTTAGVSLLTARALIKQFPETVNFAVQYKARPRQPMGPYITHERNGAELDYRRPDLIRRGSLRQYLAEYTIIMDSMSTALAQDRNNIDTNFNAALEAATAASALSKGR